MKTKSKYVLVVAVALLMGLGSCSSKDDIDNGGSTGQEEKTYTSIRFSSPMTYATQVGTPSESKIKTIDVFIYSTDGYLKNHRQFTETEFAETYSGSGVWKTNQPMETTTGKKKLYIGVNFPQAIVTSLTVTQKTIDAWINLPQQITVADIATAENFVMASDVKEGITFEIMNADGSVPDANCVNVEVKRLATKFTLEATANLTLANIDGGDFSNVQYGMGQVNTLTYIAQKIVGTAPNTEVQDPNHTSTPAGDLTGAPDETTGYQNINDRVISETPAVINALKCYYTPENTDANAISGNLTYISIRANFRPEQVWSKSGGSWEKTNNLNPAGTTFYCIKVLNVGNFYFNDVTTAENYRAENLSLASNILEYKNGTCYYTVYMNKVGNYNVLRNTFYRVKINEILSLGDVAPGPIDPTKPVGGTTCIDVTVTLEAWNLVTESSNLTP